jgi:hypothetical protein
MGVAVVVHDCHVALAPCAIVSVTGLYQTMISNCQDAEGQSRCFYKGWTDDKDATLHPTDRTNWETIMNPCYADSMDCSDAVQAVTVLGHGAPAHEKWFWTSRWLTD